MTGFVARLRAAWDEKNSLACVGLDPQIERLPAHIEPAYDGMRVDGF